MNESLPLIRDFQAHDLKKVALKSGDAALDRPGVQDGEAR